MRNDFLNLLKFLFIIIICLHHACWFDNIRHGYLPVEFFFIVSGIFIFQTYINKKRTLWEYTTKRIIRIFPTYLFMLFIYMIFSIVYPQFYKPYNYNEWLYSAISNSLLLQSTGLGYNIVRFNYPDWYLSVLFWGSIFLYFILRYRYARKFILITIVICTYSYYFIFKINNLNDIWGYYSIFYMPLWRGLAGMSTGILLGNILQKKYIKSYLDKNIHLFNLITILSFVIICFCIISPKNFDWLCIICFVLIILNLFTPNGMNKFSNKIHILKNIPDISFEMLLLHFLLIPVSVKISTLMGVLEIPMLKCFIYLFITISVSYILNKKLCPICKIYY